MKGKFFKCEKITSFVKTDFVFLKARFFDFGCIGMHTLCIGFYSFHFKYLPLSFFHSSLEEGVLF